MKKFLYFFGILALIAGLVSSCSKDEDEGGNGNRNSTVPQKKIVKVIDSEDDTIVYKYDDNKKLAFSSSNNPWMGSTKYEAYFTWEGNNVIENKTYKSTFFNDDYTTTNVYTFNSKGYLESEKYEGHYGSGNTIYKYDIQGHLISEIYTGDDGHTYTTIYEWEKGNVIKIQLIAKGSNDQISREVGTAIVEYTNQKNPISVKNVANLSIVQIGLFDLARFSPIQSNMGIAPKNLPVNMSYTEIYFDPDTNTEEIETEETNIEWEMDNEGYPIKEFYENEELKYCSAEIFWE